jgi:hypothetical protein
MRICEGWALSMIESWLWRLKKDVVWYLSCVPIWEPIQVPPVLNMLGFARTSSVRAGTNVLDCWVPLELPSRLVTKDNPVEQRC